jgi:hypothetical protein
MTIHAHPGPGLPEGDPDDNARAWARIRAPHKLIGATVRAANRTYGLLPPQDYGPEETVAEVLDAHSLLIRTAEGNVYSNGNFLLMRYAEGRSE